MNKRAIPRWLIEWGALILLIACFPYIAGLLLAPEGAIFTGNLVNVTDTNTYFTEMWLGYRGEWLFNLPFSAEPSKPIPMFLFYILLGHLARITGLSLPVVYHVSRIVCSALFIYSAYLVVKKYLREPAAQKLALAFLLFTGGWGWLMILIYGVDLPQIMIPDIWWIEAVSFNSILGIPHFTLNMALMNVCIILGERFIEKPAWRDGLLLGLAGFAVALIHAPQLAIIGFLLVLRAVLQGWKQPGWNLRSVGWIALVFLPAVLFIFYLFWLFQQDPLLKNWTSQGTTLSPPVYYLLVLYGPVLLLALMGLAHVICRRESDRYSIAAWFLLVPVLLYVPVNFQRRFIEGWHVPVTILAAMGWQEVTAPFLSRWLNTKLLKAVLGTLILSVVLSPIFFLTILSARVMDHTPDTLYYLSPDEQNALEYLRLHGDFETVVMAEFFNGNKIPAWAGVRSFIGHWDQTPDFARRKADFERFLAADTTDEERLQLLESFNISYVYLADDDLGPGSFEPRTAGYLLPVYESKTVFLYQVSIPDH